MATVNLGKIKLNWRGTWNSGVTYAIDDVVEYTDGSVTSSYIAVAASSNQAPSASGVENSSYWNFVSKGQATTPTTTRGDLIFRGESADQRLAAGTSGYFLKTLASSADPVWAEVSSSGKVLGITELINNTRVSRNNATNYDMVSGSYTQVKASSKIFWWAQNWWRGPYAGEIRYQLLYAGAEKNIGQSGYHYSNHSHRFGGHGNGMFTGDSSTGSKTVVWRESSADGQSQRSGNVHNPNSSDDSRLSQHASNVIIMEVDI